MAIATMEEFVFGATVIILLTCVISTCNCCTKRFKVIVILQMLDFWTKDDGIYNKHDGICTKNDGFHSSRRRSVGSP